LFNEISKEFDDNFSNILWKEFKLKYGEFEDKISEYITKLNIDEFKDNNESIC